LNVIELDGEIHETQKDRDGDRNTWMQANGLTVLRFGNQEILQNIEKVLQHITSGPSPAEGAGGEQLPDTVAHQGH
jgi:very-short-patch-repair endonuclease